MGLNTFNDMWGITCPQIAVEKMAQIQKEHQVWENLEEWCIAEIGEELYEKLVYGYTKKQWGREPSELPAAIIQRLPIRYTFDDGYFNDAYQGVPIHGYTVMVSNMLHDVPVYLEEDYLAKRDYWDKQAKRVVYTGALDEFFDYCYDPLDWRSLRFEHKTYAVQDYQGMAQINYTHPDIPHTRKIEHKHFANHIKTKDTIVTTEYPDKWEIGKERFYPVNDTVNNARAKAYTQKIDKQKYIFGGRLGRYQYFDMHQVIASAMKRAINECRSD
jgi:UDP-galactopyranose mutase